MPPKKQPWFRFYVEATRDQKLRMLPPSHRWLFVSLLSCARQSPIPGVLLVTESVAMTAELIADEAALSLKDTKAGLKALSALELIEWDGDAWVVTKWKERQFESDTSTDRTAKHRSMERPNDVPRNVPVAPPENREQKTEETDTEMVPTEPAKPTEIELPNQRKMNPEQRLAKSHLATLQPLLGSGKSFDLLHEFKELWPRAWAEAVDAGLNPAAVGINLLGNFIATVTDSEPDWGRAGQLVKRYGRSALYGVDEGLIANADDPYRYAFRVCQNLATENRALEEAGA